MTSLPPLRLRCSCGSKLKTRVTLGTPETSDTLDAGTVRVPVRINPDDEKRMETWLRWHATQGHQVRPYESASDTQPA